MSSILSHCNNLEISQAEYHQLNLQLESQMSNLAQAHKNSSKLINKAAPISSQNLFTLYQKVSSNDESLSVSSSKPFQDAPQLKSASRFCLLNYDSTGSKFCNSGLSEDTTCSKFCDLKETNSHTQDETSNLSSPQHVDSNKQEAQDSESIDSLLPPQYEDKAVPPLRDKLPPANVDLGAELPTHMHLNT